MQIVSPCHCEKVGKPVRCSQANFSCGKLCGKRLACGHRCPHKCHSGTCPDCMLTATVSCHCGAETQTLPCSERDFRCDLVCGKVLACGRHKCEEVCHDGSCGGCPMEGLRLCPCGKVSVSVQMSEIALLLVVICRKSITFQAALERQDLSCMNLAHHELESTKLSYYYYYHSSHCRRPLRFPQLVHVYLPRALQHSSA